MKTLTLADIKTKGSKVISDDEISYLIVNSRIKSAIIPIEDYRGLIEHLEDLEDSKDIKLRTDDEIVEFAELYEEIQNQES